MNHRTTLVAATGIIAGAVAIAAPAAGAAQPVKVDVKHGVLEVRGTHADDALVLRLDAGDPQTILVDVDGGKSDFRVARDRVDRIDVDARGGDDSVVLSDAGGAFTTTIPTTVDGGSGDDTLTGASGDETFLGGEGNDKVDGNRGSDVVALGAGDDQATWDPGDGSDVIDGNRGQDELLFNGANVGEQFDISANGDRVRFFRNVGSITMDLGGIEQIDTRALGGADRLVAGDLTGTGVTGLGIDLSATGGGEDGAGDEVIVDGTPASDIITARGSAGTVAVTGLPANVAISGANAAQDALVVFGADGDDVIDGTGLSADAIQFTANGGAGNDVLLGGAGADNLIGGDGDDVLNGGPGLDALDGGPGNNVLIQG